ncbi:MAG: DUF99 family protein [Promethearchaeota archaeon]
MKDYPITIGFDDASFKLKSVLRTTPLVGVVCQGTRMVNVVRKDILIDGDNATDVLIELIKRTEKHIQYILTDTITFGGFNIVDIQKIYRDTGKPIITVSEKEVKLELVKKALIKKFPNNYKNKFQRIINAGNLYETNIKTAGGFSKIFFHFKGIEIEEVELLFEKVCIDSKLPECVRLAHLIGKLFH